MEILFILKVVKIWVVFSLGLFINKIAMNVHIQTVLWTCVFTFHGRRDGITVSEGRCISVSLYRKLPIFQSS